MDNRYYEITRVDTLDIDIDEYTEDIIDYIKEKVSDDYDIRYDDVDDSFMSTLMKDIIKKLAEKYVDKT